MTDPIKKLIEKIKQDPAMPEQVYVLEAEDFCKGVYYNDKGQRCLSGWAHYHFNSYYQNDLLKEILSYECIKASKKSKDNFYHIPGFNDSPKRSFETLAKVWNRFIARLGYVEGNPEAKNI